MKKIHQIILFLLMILPFLLNGQSVDTLAIVRVERLLLDHPDSLYFDVRLYRNSENWSRWANGTFVLDVSDPSFQLNDQSCGLEYIWGTSGLNVQPLTGQLTKDSYHINPRIVGNRISISVIGPEKFTDANFVPADTGILVGNFLLFSKTGTMIPPAMGWLQPQYYYQACAYKLENDSIVPPEIKWNKADDNIEMEDISLKTTVRYEYDKAPEPYVKLKYFYAKYEGQRKVGLYWGTEEEYLNRGFILRRGILPYGSKDTGAVDFTDFTASYEGGFGKPAEPGMIGQGSSRVPKDYLYHYDTVPYRGETYCYSLYFKDFYDREHYLATSCVKIPNSVIVFAQANPNPMTFSTTVDYMLDDDVILECSVYDILGKKLKTLIDKEVVKVGKHQIVFEAPRAEFASQGMYEIIFLAHPIDDPGVDISRAVVKVQLIR